MPIILFMGFFSKQNLKITYEVQTSNLFRVKRLWNLRGEEGIKILARNEAKPCMVTFSPSCLPCPGSPALLRPRACGALFHLAPIDVLTVLHPSRENSCNCSWILNQIVSNLRTGTLFYIPFLFFAVLAPCSAGNKPWTITCSLITDVFPLRRSVAKSLVFLSHRFYWGCIYVWKSLNHLKWSDFCSDKLLVKPVFKGSDFRKWWVNSVKIVDLSFWVNLTCFQS